MPPHCAYKATVHPVGLELPLVVVLEVDTVVVAVVFEVDSVVVGLLPTAQVDSQPTHAPPALLVDPPEYTTPI